MPANHRRTDREDRRVRRENYVNIVPAMFRDMLHVSAAQALGFHAKLDTAGECWEWKGATNAKGYGRVRINGRLELAHRVAFAIWKGTTVLTDVGSLLVLHSCDNPRCCNPEHLRLGSYSDNNADMIARGRQRRPA
jgi:hypothetical protein